MRYLSVCSGIEAATVAWHPLGWEPAAFSEIEAFPRKVLKHHYPQVPLHGDFTTIQGDEYGPIDLLVGGTPCQSFSVAGLRGGLDDDRGNLALEFLKLAHRTRARWVVWENVPGVLSSNGGRDFGSILGGLVELGYGFSYRVLDAQYFGVPQRRRRVFVVGHLGDWRPAAAVLFERHSLQGNPPPSRKAGEGIAESTTRCFDRQSSGEYGNSPVASTVASRDYKSASDLVTFRWQNENDGIVSDPVAASLRAKGTTTDERSVGAYVAFHPTQDPIWSDDGSTHTMGTGNRNGHATVAVAFDLRGREGGSQLEGPHDTANLQAASGGSSRSYVAAVAFDAYNQKQSDTAASLRCGAGGVFDNTVMQHMAVRRLTPRECERLQGFPDDYTLLGEQTPDGPRYKALGNSMAVPVMAWIGKRIAAYEGGIHAE